MSFLLLAYRDTEWCHSVLAESMHFKEELHHADNMHNKQRMHKEWQKG